LSVIRLNKKKKKRKEKKSAWERIAERSERAEPSQRQQFFFFSYVSLTGWVSLLGLGTGVLFKTIKVTKIGTI